MTCLPIKAIPIIFCHHFPLENDDLLAHQGNSYYKVRLHKPQEIIVKRKGIYLELS